MREIGLERGKLVGDVGRVDRGGDRGRVLDRDEEQRRRCRGRDDLDLERRRRRLELARAGCGRRDRRSGERGLLDFGLDVDDVCNSSGGFDGAGGVGSLCADGGGCGGGGLGTGCGCASAGAVACGVGVGGVGGG